MTRTWWSAVLRLTAVLAGASLALSRLGLILHELAGHGGTALAFGGTITGAHLFWFAGGWIRYQVATPSVGREVAIALGGISTETAIGLALRIGLRGGRGLGARIARTAGAALLAHAISQPRRGSSRSPAASPRSRPRR